MPTKLPELFGCKVFNDAEMKDSIEKLIEGNM